MLVKVAKNVCLFVDFIKGWNLHHIIKHSGMVKEWTVTGNRKSSEFEKSSEQRKKESAMTFFSAAIC